MKITFPHMGNIYIAAKALFDGLGVDYVIPPQNNKEVLNIGTRYSPEEICLPFKIMIGNYIQAIEQEQIRFYLREVVVLVDSANTANFR